MTHTVNESMTRSLVTIRPDALMAEAYLVMRNQKIRHLPVMNEQGKVLGIVSDRDVQRSMRSKIEKVESTGELLAETTDFDPRSLVMDYMNWPVRSISVEADLREVARQMVRDKISAFLVTQDEGVIGIITTDDLLKLLIRVLDEEPLALRFNMGDVLEFSGFRLAQ